MPLPEDKSAPIVITGVGKRIGLALAQSLLAQGVPVIGTYRSETHHSELRGIIHNASHWLADDCGLPPGELIQRMMQIHVAAPYQISQTLLPQLMAGNKPGRDIIHMTDYIVEKGSKKHAAYAASKAALANLSLSLATRYAPAIKVNSIAPALILFNPDDA
jgi:dihydromonapterin reductase/dihydrofolate reductase